MGDEKNTDDTEDLTIAVAEKEPDDVTSLLTGLGVGTLKTAVFLFILFIVVSSDVFIDRILSSTDNAYVEGRIPTTRGTLVQGVLLSLGYVCIHALIVGNCL